MKRSVLILLFLICPVYAVDSAVVTVSYTLETALQRTETHSALAQSFTYHKIQAEAGIEGASALNNSIWGVELHTFGGRIERQRNELADPSLPSPKYDDLEEALYDTDTQGVAASGRIGFTKPIWDGGLTVASVREKQAQYDVVKWDYHIQLLAQKKRLISLYFSYQTLRGQLDLLRYKRDNLSQLISEKAPQKKMDSNAQELLFKRNVLEYEESLFLLSQVEQDVANVRSQLLELLGHSLDVEVTFIPITKGKIKNISQNILLISPEERGITAEYNRMVSYLAQLHAKRTWKAQFNGYYMYNVASRKEMAGEVQVNFPIKHNGVVLAKIKAVEAKIELLKMDIGRVRSQQDIKRNRLKEALDVMNNQLTLTHRRRLLADQEWEIKETSFKQGLTAFEDAFNSESVYREAIFLFKKIKFQYLENVYYYNELIKSAL